MKATLESAMVKDLLYAMKEYIEEEECPSEHLQGVNLSRLAQSLTARFLISLNRESLRRIDHQKASGIPETHADSFVSWEDIPFTQTIHRIIRTHKGIRDADDFMTMVNASYPTTHSQLDEDEFQDCAIEIQRKLVELFHEDFSSHSE